MFIPIKEKSWQALVSADFHGVLYSCQFSFDEMTVWHLLDKEIIVFDDILQ